MAGRLKEKFRGYKITSVQYPLAGAKTTGVGKVLLDLIRNGVRDSIDTLSVRLVGNVTVAGAGGGTASGAYNPNGLLVSANLQTAPTVAQLLPVNNVGSRIVTIDRALRQGAFQLGAALTDAAGVQALDAWFHFSFKRLHARKGIEFELPMNRWTSALLTLQLGTIDQLFTGSASTYDMTGVSVEFWADVDVDCEPDNIHAVEMFEIPINITASNAALDINNLPQNCFYDDLIIAAEDNGALSDSIINNIAINSAGRNWTLQDADNAGGGATAGFIRERWTRPYFNDPTTQNNLRGIYIIPLRDGLWSGGLEALNTPLDIKLNVTFTGGHTQLVRIGGRKVFPFGIRQTIRGAGGSKVRKENVPILSQ